jgi:DNA-binding XRE family transcriptional regulator
LGDVVLVVYDAADVGAEEGEPRASETFATKLKRLWEAAGLSQAELPQRAGMHRCGMAKLEQGVRGPGWATRRRW